jgi:hypothetical protein
VSGAHERPTRTTRVGDTGSPVGSPLTIVLAVIAVAVGFLIFRSISDDGNASGIGELPSATTLPTGPTTPGQTTVVGNTAAPGVTTTAAAVTETRTGASVVVANASSTGQVAQPMTDQLAELGYTMGEATSQVEGPENLETSLVYFQVGNNCEAVARTLANDMGGLTVEAMPSPIPVDGGAIDGCVLLMLGNDLAGEEIPGPPPQAPAAPTIAPTTTG